MFHDEKERKEPDHGKSRATSVLGIKIEKRKGKSFNVENLGSSVTGGNMVQRERYKMMMTLISKKKASLPPYSKEEELVQGSDYHEKESARESILDVREWGLMERECGLRMGSKKSGKWIWFIFENENEDREGTSGSEKERGSFYASRRRGGSALCIFGASQPTGK